MNPLDVFEFADFARKLNDEMPIHTETSAKIKRSYSQGLPKNLMEYSAFVDNHFLNDNLAIIEEMNHRNPKHPIPKWFRDYQIKHFAKFGILKGDNFFKKIFPTEYRHHATLSFVNVGYLARVGNSKVFGATLETTTSTVGNTNVTANYIVIASVTGTAGQYYDQIALSCFNSTGNLKLGVYRDDGINPTTKDAETSSFAADSAYTLKTVTEFALASNKTWLALITDNSNFRYNFNSSTIHYYHNEGSYTLPSTSSPLSSYSSESFLQRQKLAHS